MSQFSINYNNYSVSGGISSLLSKRKVNPAQKSQDEAKTRLSEQKPLSKENAIKRIMQNANMESKLPPLIIESIKMTIPTEEEITQGILVNNHNILLESKTGTPEDPCLGVTNPREICPNPKCKKTSMECPGHYGYIHLHSSYIWTNYITYAILILQCLCRSCSRLLVSRDWMEHQGLLNITGEARLKKLAEKCSMLRRCIKTMSDEEYEQYANRDVNKPLTQEELRNLNIMSRDGIKKCGTQPKYSVSQNKGKAWISFLEEGGSKDKRLSINEIENIFKNISKEDLSLLGFEEGAHPLNLILKAYPIIPRQARPIMYRDGMEQYDTLTTTSTDIVRYNQLIQDEEDISRRDSHVIYTHFLISHMIDNTDKELKRTQSDKVLSIVERLSQKDGLFRHHMMGKRVNFSARTVAVPANEVPFGWMYIPESWRTLLTSPIAVHHRNIKWIRELFDKGEITTIIPGKKWEDCQGCIIRIKDMFKKKGLKPQIGDVVEIFTQKGDAGAANRQPTLHKQSFMNYNIAFWKHKVIGMHMSATSPHNLDFDGDEMNLHIHQGPGAKVEANLLAHIRNCVISTHTNNPIIGIVYNGITGAYLLSDKNVIFDEDDWFDGMARAGVDPNSEFYANFEERAKYWIERTKDEKDDLKVKWRSGRLMFSLLLPEDFWYEKLDVKIRNGILIQGRLTKGIIGRSDNSIIQSMWKWHRPERTSQLLTRATWLFDWYIERRGFSIGHSDCFTPPNNQSFINKILTNSESNNNYVNWDKLLKLNEEDWIEAITLINIPFENSLSRLFITGKDDYIFSWYSLISLLLPDNYNYVSENKNISIVNGLVSRGYFTMDDLKLQGKTIITDLDNNYGPKTASEFLIKYNLIVDWFAENAKNKLKRIYSNTSNLNNEELINMISNEEKDSLINWRKLSTLGGGYEQKEIDNNNSILEEKLREKLRKEIYDEHLVSSTESIKKIILDERRKTQLKIEGLPPIKGLSASEKDYREKQIRQFVDIAKEIGVKIGLTALPRDNPFNIMTNAGSKGTEVNTAQITGCVGQQFVQGERPAPVLTGGTRVTVYSDPNSEDIADHGDCIHSFMEGVTPIEMVYIAMSTRISLMDTGVKTAEVGWMQHKMIKVLENMKVHHDGSVRSSSNAILSHSFYDGFACEELVRTDTKTTGKIVSFINLEEAVGRVNAEMLKG